MPKTMLDITKRNGSVPDLKSVRVAVVGGKDVSLHEALYTLKLKGQLGAVVSQTVTDRLIADAAARAGITVAADELQKAADAFRMGRGLNRADDTKRWLEHHQLSRADLEAGLRRAMLSEKMMHRIAPPERVQQYFTENRSRFDRARLSRIVVPNEGLARELLTQFHEDGKDFADAARQHGLDRHLREAGGHIGIVPRKSLPPAIEATVFNAKPGEVVGPFLIGQAYHLIKVEEVLRGEMPQHIGELLRRELFHRWLGEQAQANAVQINVHQCV